MSIFELLHPTRRGKQNARTPDTAAVYVIDALGSYRCTVTGCSNHSGCPVRNEHVTKQPTCNGNISVGNGSCRYYRGHGRECHAAMFSGEVSLPAPRSRRWRLRIACEHHGVPWAIK